MRMPPGHPTPGDLQAADPPDDAELSRQLGVAATRRRRPPRVHDHPEQERERLPEVVAQRQGEQHRAATTEAVGLQLRAVEGVAVDGEGVGDLQGFTAPDPGRARRTGPRHAGNHPGSTHHRIRLARRTRQAQRRIPRRPQLPPAVPTACVLGVLPQPVPHPVPLRPTILPCGQPVYLRLIGCLRITKGRPARRPRAAAPRSPSARGAPRERSTVVAGLTRTPVPRYTCCLRRRATRRGSSARAGGSPLPTRRPRRAARNLPDPQAVKRACRPVGTRAGLRRRQRGQGFRGRTWELRRGPQVSADLR